MALGGSPFTDCLPKKYSSCPRGLPGLGYRRCASKGQPTVRYDGLRLLDDTVQSPCDQRRLGFVYLAPQSGNPEERRDVYLCKGRIYRRQKLSSNARSRRSPAGLRLAARVQNAPQRRRLRTTSRRGGADQQRIGATERAWTASKSKGEAPISDLFRKRVKPTQMVDSATPRSEMFAGRTRCSARAHSKCNR